MITDERRARIHAVAARRQLDLAVFMESVHKPHNLSAVARTCDAVGVMDVHAVPGESGLSAMRSASQGAHRWIRIHRHTEAGPPLEELAGKGYQRLAAHLSDEAVDFRTIDYTRPTVVVLGTEKFGLQEKTLEHCDRFVTIPMVGMAQSLNVSVAAAVILFEAQRQREAAGMYDSQAGDSDYRRALADEWMQREFDRRTRRAGQG